MSRPDLSHNLIHPDLLKQVLTFVLAGGEGRRLHPLTRDRSKPAVPFGGTFRIIDFSLSNCINSGLRRVFVLTQYKADSLMRHLNLGWNIFVPELGEFICALPPQLRVSDHWYLGTADAIYQNVYSIEREKSEHVLILSGDHIYRMDYRDLLVDHLQRQADLTLGVVHVPKAEANRFGIVQANDEGFVSSYIEKPEQVETESTEVLANMGVFLFRTSVLMSMVRRDAEIPNSRHDFGHDVIPVMLKEGARVAVHHLRGAGEEPCAYWRDIGTRDAFYEANMDLVNVSPQFNLYDNLWPIRSVPIQGSPAKFVFTGGDIGRVGQAHDSLVSPGAIISGGHVFRSILSPECRINSWSRVEESILFHGVHVGRHSIIRRAIIDKGVIIPPNTHIGVDRTQDERRFTVTHSGVVVVPRGEVL